MLRIFTLMTAVAVAAAPLIRPVLAAQTLSLDEAVNIALAAKDPTVVRFEERALALDDRGGQT